MLRTIVSLGVAALFCAAVASAAPGPPRPRALGLTGHTASASLSNDSAGARSVAITIALPAELRCGRLSASSLRVRLPHAMRVPRSIRSDAVRSAGQAVRSVRTNGSTIIVQLLPAGGMTCDSIVSGVARLQFSRQAHLGNPPRAGSRAFSVEAEPSGYAWYGRLVVRS